MLIQVYTEHVIKALSMKNCNSSFYLIYLWNEYKIHRYKGTADIQFTFCNLDPTEMAY